jgi:hypothetical protein
MSPLVVNNKHFYMRIYRNITGVLTKTGPPIGCEAESLLAGTAEGARDVETERLASPILDSTFINIWSTHHCYSTSYSSAHLPLKVLETIFSI